MLPMGYLTLVILAKHNVIPSNSSGTLPLQCPNRFCKYCKKDGHIIKECPIRPPRPISRALQAVSVQAVDSSLLSIADPSTSVVVMPQGIPV